MYVNVVINGIEMCAIIYFDTNNNFMADWEIMRLQLQLHESTHTHNTKIFQYFSDASCLIVYQFYEN